MNNLWTAINLLKNDISCVLCNDDEQLIFKDRGIKPLLSLLVEEKKLDAFSLADKIIGRAIAFLVVKANIKYVFAQTISQGAIAIFNQYHIAHQYLYITDAIINRTNTGLCPMEEAVQEITDPNQAYQVINNRFSQLKQ